MALLHPVRVEAAPAEVVRGPVFSGTLGAPRPFGAIAMKGVVVTAGPARNAHFCFDTDLMRLSMAWTGDFVEFGNTQTQIAWPPPPVVKGNPLFATRMSPGWAREGSFNDPRPRGQGPLPKEWAHFEGMHMHGDQVVIRYRLGKTVVLETPSFHEFNEQKLLVRSIQFETESNDQTLLLADGVEGSLGADFSGSPAPLSFSWMNGKTFALSGANLPERARLEVIQDKRLVLKLPRIPAAQTFQLIFSDKPDAAGFTKLAETKPVDLRTLTRGGPAKWTEIAVTQGTRSEAGDAYVVDTLTEPADNPYHAKMFLSGFDFLEDGRAAICTFHGDVWIVSGIDDRLNKLIWRRYATGLFQPLGLKVVQGMIYVLGRDQITRLQDLNKDGEADYYENFNNDSIVSANYHEFSMDLQTDRAGNFYYAKGAPWEPEVISPHQGSLIKVLADGSGMEVYATGFRAPNGMAIGPRDEITVSDNQGHWIPSSKLNWVERGGFYGMTPAAQKELKLERGGTNFTANPSDYAARRAHRFKGWEAGSPIPSSYDQPLAWLPMSMDNSSGGQVWTSGAKWGPLSDRLLFMSYGKCTLFEVMTQEVEGVRQAAMVQLPLKFHSGIMRGRVNPIDGQVYLCGLKGWQTSATRDGGFYRVRYTGKPARLPSAFAATKSGVRIGFTTALDLKAAGDMANYSFERWNYVYSGGYGSPDVSVLDPAQKKREVVEIKSARVSSDGTQVTLEIPGMRTSDQVRIRYNIAAKDGTPMNHEVHGTVHKLGN